MGASPSRALQTMLVTCTARSFNTVCKHSIVCTMVVLWMRRSTVLTHVNTPHSAICTLVKPCLQQNLSLGLAVCVAALFCSSL